MADSHFLEPHEIVAIAERIERRAARGRIVQLLPETAKLCAGGLRMKARPPRREEIVRVICGTKRCDMRNSCYHCLGKANEIMRILNGD